MALGVVGGAGGVTAAQASAAISISSNWSGYVATAPAHSAKRFKKVSGTWVEPTATCTAGHETYSAAWVGLGGFASRSQALEQIGTDADCTSSGEADYYAWFELVPADAVELKLEVRPGDHISASVAAVGHTITLRIRDLTTGAKYATKRRMSSPAPDVSAADWIVEAPSLCATEADCRTLPLTNFGTVGFLGGSAVLGAHTGAIGDPAFSLTGSASKRARICRAVRMAGHACWRRLRRSLRRRRRLKAQRAPSR